MTLLPPSHCCLTPWVNHPGLPPSKPHFLKASYHLMLGFSSPKQRQCEEFPSWVKKQADAWRRDVCINLSIFPRTLPHHCSPTSHRMVYKCRCSNVPFMPLLSPNTLSTQMEKEFTSLLLYSPIRLIPSSISGLTSPNLCNEVQNLWGHHNKQEVIDKWSPFVLKDNITPCLYSFTISLWFFPEFSQTMSKVANHGCIFRTL